MMIEKKVFFAKFRKEYILVFCILALAFFLRARLPDTSYLNIYAARDIQRSVLLLEGKKFPWYGPETTYWKRLHGPFLYLLQIPPLMVTYDPAGLIVWIALLATIAIFFTYKIGKEFLGGGAGIYAALMWSLFPLSISNLRWFWNPVYLFPLTTIILYLVMQAALKGKTHLLPWITALIFLSSQIHLSAYFLLVSAALVFIVFRIRPKKREILLTLLAILIVNSPYLIARIKGIKEIEKIPLISSFKREKHVISFNPNYFVVLKQNCCVQDNEHVTNAGFVNITPYFEDIESQGKTTRSFFLKSALIGSNVIWLFFWAGVLFSLVNFVLLQKFRCRINNDKTIISTKALLILLIWIVPASLGLMFWNFSDPQKIYPPEYMLGKKVYSCIPHRYFFVIYPVQFLLTGYVFGLLGGSVRSVYNSLLKNRLSGTWEKKAVILRRVIVGFLVCFLMIPQLYLSWKYISDTHESKIWGYHCGYRVRPIYTVGFTKSLVRRLIQGHDLTLNLLQENRLIFFLVYGFIDRELEIDYFFLHLDKIFPGMKWESQKDNPNYSHGEYMVVTDQPRERWDQFLLNSQIVSETRILTVPGIPLTLYRIISDPRHPPAEYLNWRNPYFDRW